MNINKLLILISVLFILPATFNANAAEKIQAKGGVRVSQGISRHIDPLNYTKGRRLYLQNCAVCHGKRGEGAENWQRPDEEGKYKAPPLNGTGHTWHHSPMALINTIKNGTGKLGGNMPAWKSRLTDDEIKLILSWILAEWPDEIYTAWYNRFHQK